MHFYIRFNFLKEGVIAFEKFGTTSPQVILKFLRTVNGSETNYVFLYLLVVVNKMFSLKCIIEFILILILSCPYLYQ